MTRSPSLLLLACVLATCAICASPPAIAAVESQGYDAASAQAQKLFGTKAGHAYTMPFMQAVLKAFYDAMQICEGNSKASLKCDIVFIVSADGHIEQTLSTDENDFARCILNNLHLPAKVPTPPEALWPIQMHLLNRPRPKHPSESDFPALTLYPPAEAVPQKGEPPKDTPFGMTSDKQISAYDKAIAPYIAKGRATYPAAKKRFLAGLPAGYNFAIKTRLKDKSGSFEDSFIGVRKIENGKVFGVVDSKLEVVKDYTTGQRIVIPESKIDDWVIVRPDGQEEGNYVGKFMDTMPR